MLPSFKQPFWTKPRDERNIDGKGQFKKVSFSENDN